MCGESTLRLKTGPTADSHKAMYLVLDAIQSSLYLHSSYQPRRSKGFGSGNPVKSMPLAEGSVTLSQVSFTALRVILAKPLILCIEDNPMHLTLRKKVLEREGYTVIGVTTATDALKVLREAHVWATIADHMLQGTTGTQLANEMKKIKPDVPIIMFSGTVPEHFDGVDVFINKGQPTAEFLRIVREVIERYCF